MVDSMEKLSNLLKTLPGKYPHIPTRETGEAIERRSGPLYDILLEVTQHLNPKLTRGELEHGLSLLLGPQTVQDVFMDGPQLKIPDFVKTPDGQTFQILETDIAFIAHAWVGLNGVRTSIQAQWRDGQRYAALREQYLQEGGDPEQFDAVFVAHIRELRERCIHDARARAHALRGVSPTADPAPKGCGTTILMMTMLIVFVVVRVVTAH